MGNKKLDSNEAVFKSPTVRASLVQEVGKVEQGVSRWQKLQEFLQGETHVQNSDFLINFWLCNSIFTQHKLINSGLLSFWQISIWTETEMSGSFIAFACFRFFLIRN